MTGWKTKVGGIGSIMLGVATILNALADGEITLEKLQGGLAFIVAGFAALGLGHKLEKVGLGK